MKRQVAIRGDTPPFIAWSIRLACELKRDVAVAEPQSVESSLRAIRMASEAISENQTLDDLVFRFNDDARTMPEIFSLDEISLAFGGWNRVAACCLGCSANVDNRDLAAGCFGWLSIADFSSKKIDDDCFASHRKCLHLAGIPETTPQWYGLWMRPELQGAAFFPLLELFEQVARVSEPSNQLRHFIAALQACQQHAMIMDVRSFPAGFADELNWKILPHCPECRATMREKVRACEVCGRKGSAHPSINRKVRGHRPFVPLDQRFEKSEATRLHKLIVAKAKSLEPG